MSFSFAALVIIIVVGLLVGGLMTLRSSAKTGMPSQQVLERAKQRAKELQDEERREDKDR